MRTNRKIIGALLLSYVFIGGVIRPAASTETSTATTHDRIPVASARASVSATIAKLPDASCSRTLRATVISLKTTSADSEDHAHKVVMPASDCSLIEDLLEADGTVLNASTVESRSESLQPMHIVPASASSLRQPITTNHGHVIEVIYNFE